MPKASQQGSYYAAFIVLPASTSISYQAALFVIQVLSLDLPCDLMCCFIHLDESHHLVFVKKVLQFLSSTFCFTTLRLRHLLLCFTRCWFFFNFHFRCWAFRKRFIGGILLILLAHTESKILKIKLNLIST